MKQSVMLSRKLSSLPTKSSINKLVTFSYLKFTSSFILFSSLRIYQTMFTNITSTVKTKKGKVQKLQKEHYLRDDIICGLSTCTMCSSIADTSQTYLPAPLNYNDPNSIAHLLKTHPIDSLNDFTKTTLSQLRNDIPVILIPDHSIFFSQMDLLESNTPPFSNIIVLRSILKEMEHRHNRTYQRIRSLIANSTHMLSTLLNKNVSSDQASAKSDSNAKAFIFENTFHRSTFIHPSTDTLQDRLLAASGGSAKHLLRHDNKRRKLLKYGSHSEMGDEENQFIDSDDDESDDQIENLISVTEFGDVMGLEHSRLKGIRQTEYEEALIVKATKWLITHIGDSAQIILLTNDTSVAKRASEVFVPVLSAEQYVQCVSVQYPGLNDILAKTIKDAEKRESEQWIYEPHVEDAELRQGLQAGVFLKGRFNVDRDYFSQGTVSVPGMSRFLIPDFRRMNRAISGDDVIIRVLDRADWEAPRNIIPVDDDVQTTTDDGTTNFTLDGHSRSQLDAELASAERPDANTDELDLPAAKEQESSVMSNEAPRSVMPTAMIVGIWSRNTKPYCGTVAETDRTDGRVFFLPVNRCIPRFMIQSQNITDLQTKRIIVAFDNWPATSRHPNGHLVKVLGEIGDTQTETEVVLAEFDVRHDSWSKDVEKCLPGDEYEINEQECEGRVDLRALNICSIDPPGCTDIDDALHCTRLPDGTFEVGVHIADVTHYIRPGSALDMEASQRSTSVYLVDRRIDMIPARLSTDICSLHQRVDRLAFSTVWKMTKDAEILETRFFKSVINSKAAFTYADAQERINLKDEGTDPLTWACRDLMHLARCLKQGRTDNGALTLASSEVKFEMNASRTKPLGLGAYQMKEANSLVEEFMLLANVSVARHILRAYPTFALLRRHPTPAPEMLEPLVRACKRWGFDIDISSGKALNDSLNKVILKDNPSFNRIVRMLTTRCLTQAVYTSAGDTAEKQLNHFGLAAPFYTHFTSPIRRYSDIVVHRLLATSLGIAPLPDLIKDRASMRDVIDNMNLRHRNAQLASRSSTQIWTLAYFSAQPKPVQQQAVILDVKSTGIRVIVPDLGIECPIVVAKQGQQEALGISFDPETITLTTADGKSYTVFQRVMVRITVEMDRLRRQKLVVKLIDDTEPIINPVKGTA